MTKLITYTEEQAQELGDRYTAGETVAELAKDFGKTVQSVVAKLVRMQLYKKADKPTEVNLTKAQLVAVIAGKLGVEVDSVTDMEKLNKSTLQLLAETV